MAGLPIYLQAGTVSIYGLGDYVGVSDITPADQQVFRIGTVYQSWDNSSIVGQSVMFREADVTCRLAFNDYPYTVVHQAKLVATEIPTM
jgi:hypothetical protein